MLKIKNLRPWEKVIMVLRRHWIVYVLLSLVFSSWLLFTILTYSILWWNYITNIINIIFWMFFSVLMYIKWLDHELDMYVITNNRVIGIDQIGFLDRKKTECNLWQVQEVNARTKWVFANLLGYWTVTILTAWNTTNMVMDFAPNSMEEARKMLNIVDDYRDSKEKIEEI